MKLSVITVNYNHRDGLEKTILSVIGQKEFDDYEYIIIDGGSTDGSRQVIEKYASHIDYWISETDDGVYNAMNKGIKVAKGDYCIFMNSGDKFYSDNTLMKAAAFLNNGADILIGKTFSNGCLKNAPSDNLTGLTLFWLPNGLSVCHQSTFTRTVLLKDSPYDVSYKIAADRAFLFEQLIMKNKSYQAIDVIICEYENNGLSAQNWNMMKEEKERFLTTLLPNRIYQDYMSINYATLMQNSELFSLLSKYSYSKTDLSITVRILKLIYWLKEQKVKLQNLLK